MILQPFEKCVVGCPSYVYPVLEVYFISSLILRSCNDKLFLIFRSFYPKGHQLIDSC